MPPHAALISRNRPFTRRSNTSGGTPRNKVASLHVIVDDHARRAAADRVHARQMRRGALQRIHDLVEVPLRVRLRHRVPVDFLAEDDFPVHDRRGLAIARAEVEANPASVQMPAQRDRLDVLCRQLAGPDGENLERALEDAPAHDVLVERRPSPFRRSAAGAALVSSPGACT